MIVINVDVMLAKRKMSVTELADRVGITIANMSVLKRITKTKRISTLNRIRNQTRASEKFRKAFRN